MRRYERDVAVEKYLFRMTSTEDPEQYHVSVDDQTVGHVCLRRGRLTVRWPNAAGEVVYTANLRRRGKFGSGVQRRTYLRRAKLAIEERMQYQKENNDMSYLPDQVKPPEPERPPCPPIEWRAMERIIDILTAERRYRQGMHDYADGLTPRPTLVAGPVDMTDTFVIDAENPDYFEQGPLFYVLGTINAAEVAGNVDYLFSYDLRNLIIKGLPENSA